MRGVVMTNLQPGIYRHFKGREYRVHGLGNDSETREVVVVYEPLYEHEGERFSVRPLSMFVEHVERDEYSGPRFALVRAEGPSIPSEEG